MCAYKTILVAIDLQGGANEVLDRAKTIMVSDNAKLIILNAGYHSIPDYAGSIGEHLFQANKFYIDDKSIVQQAKQELFDLAEENNVPTNNIMVEFGRPVDVILAVAKRKNADLIVLGSHGTHGVGLLLGSTANGVLHRANCDVLAVRISDSEE